MNALKRLYRLFKRPPDFYIGGKENPQILRWWIIPRNRFFNVYLHNRLRDDDHRALHDHPWFNISIILKGGYSEIVPVCSSLYPDDYRIIHKDRKPGNIIFRRASSAHMLQLNRNGSYNGVWHRIIPSWSIIITGPRVREWGFWCASPTGFRWVHWKEFTDPSDSGKVGKGCGK